jgi:hypothetical protein
LIQQALSLHFTHNLHVTLCMCTLQLRLKEIVGRALLHTDQATKRAALVIPVKVPPRIYRLKPREEYVDATPRAGMKRFYAVKDGIDWLRAKDFTPQAAFGRSFAYRCPYSSPMCASRL